MFTYNVKWYGNVDTTISGSGNLTPVSQQTMAVEQPVTVTAVNYAAGDNVEEGTVIATAEDAQGGSIDYTAPYDCVLLELPVSSGDELEAGGEVVLEKVRSNLQAVIGRDTKEESRSTGELVSALGVSPAKIDREGNYNVKVGFSEPRSDGRSNAMIANVLEYGKSGQPAKPFLKPARTASRAPCIEAMKRTFEQEVEKI